MPSKWITRERPQIDRIACPWLIRRFIANDAEFIYVPTEQVFAVAKPRPTLRPTTYRAPNHSPITANCAASTPSSPRTAHRSRTQTTWRSSCVVRTRRAPISRHRLPDCTRSLSACPRISPTTMRCSSTAWSSTTPSTPGVDALQGERTIGRLLRARRPEQWPVSAPGLSPRLLRG